MVGRRTFHQNTPIGQDIWSHIGLSFNINNTEINIESIENWLNWWERNCVWKKYVSDISLIL